MPPRPRKLSLAVRDFALPTPRVGSIEAHSGYGPVPQQGSEIHLRVQAARAAAHPEYQAERPLAGVFAHPRLQVKVSGRIDGLFAGPTPICEELKTAIDAAQLVQRLAAEAHHPYWLQLQTYAYLYYQMTGTLPHCRLTVVSARTLAETVLEHTLDLTDYRDWLARRLEELAKQEAVLAKRSLRRKHLGAGLRFPFATPRPGQEALMDFVATGAAAGAATLIEAPTGLGKTLGIMLPALRASLQEGAPLLYLTPKNSQHVVPETAARQLGKVRTLTLTAKSRICMKEAVVCNPQYCEFARDYYAKMDRDQLAAKLAKRRSVTEATLRDWAQRFEVCPAELALDAAPAFDLIIGDYNYVIQPHGLLGRITAALRGKKSKPGLVIDEAHNLYARAAENLSAALGVDEICGLAQQAASYLAPHAWAAALASELAALAAATTAWIAGFGPTTRAVDQLTTLAAGLAPLQARWQEWTAAYLASEATLAADDPVLALSAYVRNFADAVAQAALAALVDRADATAGVPAADAAAALLVDSDADNQDPEAHVADFGAPPPAKGVTAFTALYERRDSKQILRLICCDAAVQLAASFKPFGHVTGFSATLRPFEFYARLSGFAPDRVRTASFPSPFPAENRKVLVIPQVSTKLRDRAREYHRIADAIARLTAVHPGNYIAFFPSFQFLDAVSRLLSVPGFVVIVQRPGLSRAGSRDICARLRAGGAPVIVLAVQGGSLAEGLDFPGEQLIGAIIVGPAIPSYDVPREILRRYYETRYGHGEDYAYTIPAMAKVVQAAGRVIRTATDRGLIILMDARFTQPGYSSLLPLGWFQHSVQELVSRSILEDVSRFWANPGDAGSAPHCGG